MYRADIRTDVFRTRDVVQIALQRTSGLVSLPLIGRVSLRAWKRGISLPLYLEAVLRRGALLQSALGFVGRDFDLIKAQVSGRPIRSIIDIGCGHALIDLHLYRQYEDPRLFLVDVEETSHRHLGYHRTAAGYASLDSAKRFLVANGVPSEKVETLNPRVDEMNSRRADLIISFLSAGFHYPLAEYKAFITSSLAHGGVLIFDLAKAIDESEFLKRFSSVRCIRETGAARKLLCVYQ